MRGAHDLAVLLATLEPRLSAEEMIFCTFPDFRIAERLLPAPRGHTTVCSHSKALVQFEMDIWDDSPRTILNLLLSSTSHQFCFSEILDGTGLARGTVSSNLRRLSKAHVVFRQKERFNYDHPPRAPYVYYTLNPLLIDHLRLHAPST